MLMHCGDAHGIGFLGIRPLNRLAFPNYATARRAYVARKDLDESGFSGPIGAQKAMHPSPLDFDVHATQGDDVSSEYF